jgi:hypothetical protein
VSKADLHRLIWPETFVSDGSLAVLIVELRRALGDDAQRPSFIRTVNRFGYAFIDVPARSVPQAAGGSCTLAWGTERVRLRAGENVIGRDAAADICIDAVGVSRRHAVIVVRATSATLSDLGSKNGTFAAGERVTSPVALSDDTEIRLGAVALRFRRLGAAITQTVGA